MLVGGTLIFLSIRMCAGTNFIKSIVREANWSAVIEPEKWKSFQKHVLILHNEICMCISIILNRMTVDSYLKINTAFLKKYPIL